jgi:transcriptional regulator with XRE-family HTH domain
MTNEAASREEKRVRRPQDDPNFVQTELDMGEFDFGRIGRRIRERRIRHGLTTAELAERAGVTRQTIVRLESGKPCTLETFHKVRSSLRIFTDFLLREEQERDFCVQHHPATAHWTVSRQKTTYQKNGTIADPTHEDDPRERMRLGKLGFQPFFTCLLNAELPGGLLNQGLMEIYKETWVDSHPGEEFIYCLQGRCRMLVRDEEFILEEGGALTFNAVEPHQYAPADPLGPNDPPLLLLIVVALPPKRLK